MKRTLAFFNPREIALLNPAFPEAGSLNGPHASWDTGKSVKAWNYLLLIRPEALWKQVAGGEGWLLFRGCWRGAAFFARKTSTLLLHSWGQTLMCDNEKRATVVLFKMCTREQIMESKGRFLKRGNTPVDFERTPCSRLTGARVLVKKPFALNST